MTPLLQGGVIEGLCRVMNDNLRSSWGMSQQMRVTAAAALVPVLGEGEGGGIPAGVRSHSSSDPKGGIHVWRGRGGGSWTGRGARSCFTRVFCFSRHEDRCVTPSSPIVSIVSTLQVLTRALSTGLWRRALSTL